MGMKITTTILRARTGVITQFLLTLACAAGYKVNSSVRTSPNLAQPCTLHCDVETKQIGFFDFNQAFDGPILEDTVYEGLNEVTFEKATKQLGADPQDLRGLPVVEFDYPAHGEVGSAHLHRVLIVTEANDTTIMGMEVSDRGRFKRFLQDKIKKLSLVGFKQK